VEGTKAKYEEMKKGAGEAADKTAQAGKDVGQRIKEESDKFKE
jgi:gas vesicle protein